MYAHSAHTPLSWAVVIGAYDCARALMEAGWASIAGSSRYASDGTRLPRPSGTEREIVADALDMAGRAGHEDTGQRLLRHGPDLAFEAFSGGTALQ